MCVRKLTNSTFISITSFTIFYCPYSPFLGPFLALLFASLYCVHRGFGVNPKPETLALNRVWCLGSVVQACRVQDPPNYKPFAPGRMLASGSEPATVLDCQRWEEVRFVATRLCLIVKYCKKHDLLPPGCVALSQMGRSTICCFPFVLDCHRWVEVRFVATRLCLIVTDGKKYDCCHHFVLDCQRWEGVQFVATRLCLIVKYVKKHDLLPPGCVRLSQWGRSTIFCRPFVLDCHRWEKYDLLPLGCVALSQMGRSTICCHPFVLDCLICEEARFVATRLCSIVTDGKKYDLLPLVCA